MFFKLLFAILSTTFLLPSIPKDINSNSQLGNIRATSVTSINDGDVYFVRSCYDDSMAWDVRSGNYTSGNDIVLYQATNMSNQRFVFRKADANRWYIIPQYTNDDLYLTVQNGTSYENEKIVLSPATYTSSMCEANRFYITYNSSYSSFTITTLASKYVAVTSTSSLTEVVQKSAPSGGLSNHYRWKIVATDGISVNTTKTFSCSANSYTQFNIKLNRTLEYKVVSKINCSSRLNLYSSSGAFLTSGVTNASGYKEISYVFSKFSEYKLRFYNDTNSTLTITICLYPIKESYFYTYYNPSAQDGLNTTNDAINQMSKFEGDGYFLHHINNGSSYKLCSAINPNGLISINNKYFTISSHGSAGNDGGYTWTSPTDGFNVWNLPSDMSNVEVALWATCYGGSTGSFADVITTSRGAHYAIGWPGLSDVHTGNVFVNHFWSSVFDDYSISDSFYIAKQAALDSIWYIISSLTGDSLADLLLYEHSSAPTSNIDFSKISYDFSNFVPFESKDLPNGYILFQENPKIKRFVKIINGHPSNDYFVYNNEDGKLYKSKYNVSFNSISHSSSYVQSTDLGDESTIFSEILYINDGINTIPYKMSLVREIYQNRICQYFKIHSFVSGAKELDFEEVSRLFYGI